MTESTPDLTVLLQRWQQGESGALEELEPLVHRELRRLASSYLRSERSGHTLQATDLVHEAFLRLFGSGVDLRDRHHFYALAARTMRRILVDHARTRARQKRGGGLAPVTLDEALTPSDDRPDALLALDDALSRLATLDDRQERVIELHYFGGLTYEEAGEILDVSAATVKRDLRSARAFLQRELMHG